MFRLDPAFEATSATLISLALCDARLQLDARFPWIVLIPRAADAVELEDLTADSLTLVIQERRRSAAPAFEIGMTDR